MEASSALAAGVSPPPTSPSSRRAGGGPSKGISPVTHPEGRRRDACAPRSIGHEQVHSALDRAGFHLTVISRSVASTAGCPSSGGLTATFNFYAIQGNVSVRSGSFALTGSYSAKGLQLTPDHSRSVQSR